MEGCESTGHHRCWTQIWLAKARADNPANIEGLAVAEADTAKTSLAIFLSSFQPLLGLEVGRLSFKWTRPICSILQSLYSQFRSRMERHPQHLSIFLDALAKQSANPMPRWDITIFYQLSIASCISLCSTVYSSTLLDLSCMILSL